MRRITAYVTAASFLLASVAQAPVLAQSSLRTPQQTAALAARTAVATTFQAFPNGGPELKDRLTAMVVSNPDIAPEIVHYVRTTPRLNQEQRAAAEQGLAEALNRIGALNQGDPGAPGIPSWAIALGIIIAGGLLYWGLKDGDDSDDRRAPVSPN